jgi:hypothetical protein
MGWTDGLPVIPPTEELVRAMLKRSRHEPGEVLGRMQPLDGVVTVERGMIDSSTPSPAFGVVSQASPESSEGAHRGGQAGTIRLSDRRMRSRIFMSAPAATARRTWRERRPCDRPSRSS